MKAGSEKGMGAATGLDPRVLKALAHPVRVQALQVLNSRGVASPNEIAQALGGHPKVRDLAYHIRVLNECDCIELVDTKQRRGATEHYYRPTADAFFSADDWKKVPETIRSSISGAMWNDILPVIFSSMEAGTFDNREDMHFSWVPMRVDEEGWNELHTILDEALPKVLEVKVKSGARLMSGSSHLDAAVLMVCFETAADNRSAES